MRYIGAVALLPSALDQEVLSTGPSKKLRMITALKAAERFLAVAAKRGKYKRLLPAIMLFLVALGAGPAANSAIVTTTITGVVYSGIIVAGLFGVTSGYYPLSGQSFTLVLTFDDTKGTQSVQNLLGTPCGSAINNTATSNPGTAVLTINNESYTFGALPGFSQTSSLSRTTGSCLSQIQFKVMDASSSNQGQDYVSGLVLPAPGTVLTTDYNWEDSFSDSALGSQLLSVFIDTTVTGTLQEATIALSATSITVKGLQPGGSNSTGVQFVPVTPCRVADTRNATGPFGGPELVAGTSREFDIPQSACGIPSTAAAYSLNVTAVPTGPLGYLTLWPSGQAQPTVSTLNSDGRVKANAAITPAGTNGGVSVFVTNPSQVILDIDGYFVPAGTASALAFYPVTPCRVADTRNANGPLGGPSLASGGSRDFAVQTSSCGLPSDAQAYSLNVTAVPKGSLGYLTMWPSGQSQPLVSTLNSPTGAVTANAAIVPAGSNGNVSVYVSDGSDVVLDVNGYFAAPGANGLSLYTTTPCRVLDTRSNSGALNGTLGVSVESSSCAPLSTAQAYVLNATVVPTSSLGYLTLWPAGETQPAVSTLNANNGAVTSNMAIVPTLNGSIDAFSSNPTQLILDLSSYFAP